MADTRGSVEIRPTPDPTVLTTEATARAKEAADRVETLRDAALQRELKLRQQQRESETEHLKERLEAATDDLTQRTDDLRAGDSALFEAKLALLHERVDAIRREQGIYEQHRLELKVDGKETLATATIAAEKAVQAALAAAEKARDQQTIASQLATTKAEDASKDQMNQQGERFTLAIASLTTGLNDVKAMLGELRAEKRGSQDQVVVTRSAAEDMKPVLDVLAKLVEAQAMTAGQKQQVGETQAKSSNIGLVVGLGITAFFGLMGMIISIVSLLIKVQG